MYLTVLSILVLVVNFLPQRLHGDEDFDKSTLQLAQVLFRHGDRNPVTSYPTDPNDLTSNWPEGYGQLTNIGKRQMYEFGKYLRTRYDGYLDNAYFVNDTKIWSSDSDRNIMSSLAALTGLYPGNIGGEVWNPESNFQIVPVHSIPNNVDRILSMERDSCANFKNVVKNFIKTSDYMRDLNMKAKDLLQYVSLHSGLKIKYVGDVFVKLHDTLSIQLSRNMSIPTWAEPLMKPDSEFKKTVEKCYSAFSRTPEMRRLYSGELVKELLKNMKARAEGQSELRLILFAGHDLTLTNLMNTIGIYNEEMPPYGASLLFELHKNPQSSLVKIFYRGEADTEPKLKPIPECGDGCTLQKFEELVSPSISKDWEEECRIPASAGNQDTASQILSNNSASAFASTFTVLMVTMMGMVVFYSTA